MYDMSYADDILTVGPQGSADWFYNVVAQRLLIKHLGALCSDLKSMPFLGRVLQREGKGIHLQAPKAYINDGHA